MTKDSPCAFRSVFRPLLEPKREINHSGLSLQAVHLMLMESWWPRVPDSQRIHAPVQEYGELTLWYAALLLSVSQF